MQVKRAFLVNILLLLLVNLLIKPFFIFGIDLSVQNRAATGEYGLYFALLNWAYLFQIISDFGLQNYNTRHVSGHPHLLPKYFPKLFALKLLLSLLYFLVAMAAAAVLANYPATALTLLALLLTNQILVQLILFLRTNISGLGHYRLDSLLSSLDKLLMLLTCGAALLWWPVPPDGHFPILGFIVAQTAALLLTLGLVWWILARKQKITVDLRFNRHRHILWHLFRESRPYAVVILLMAAYTRLDGVLLERLLPDGAFHNDIFAGAYRILDALNMFGYLFATLLLPMFSRQLAAKEDVRPLTALGFRLIWAGSLTVCLAIALNSTALVVLMFGQDDTTLYRAQVGQILIWSFLAICITYIFSTLLTADERLRQMNLQFAVAIALNLALNLLLVPRYQATGSAMVSLLTQSYVALAMMVICWRRYAFQMPAKALLQWLLFTGGTVALAFGWANAGLTDWQTVFSGILVTGGMLAVLTGWLDWKALRKV